MTLSPADLAAVEAAWEIEIETRAASDAPVHSTIIWAVTDGPDAFVRSVNGSDARWYREAVAHPEVVVHIGERRIPARAVAAADSRVRRPDVARVRAQVRPLSGHGLDDSSRIRSRPHLRLEPA